MKAKGVPYCYRCADILQTLLLSAPAAFHALRLHTRPCQLGDQHMQRSSWCGRCRVVPDQEVVIPDLIRGDVTFNTSTLGDFVILRSNGLPVYVRPPRQCNVMHAVSPPRSWTCIHSSLKPMRACRHGRFADTAAASAELRCGGGRCADEHHTRAACRGAFAQHAAPGIARPCALVPAA